ncbi:unnamed protein product [Anisakis simplex]|uniref:Legumain (inferred by orthology to a human protein) n=1 Tax=Anisakis simplex TaxID=6269 RepID=A0A0M3K1P2_ANISI|nr:unnamed protein product [Anisakis simplex]
MADTKDSKTRKFDLDQVTGYELTETLKRMKRKKQFNKLAIYLDSHYSGSMFDGILPSNIGVYAVTSSDVDQASASTECGMDELPCLATEFPKSWLYDLDMQEFGTNQTLREQYEVVYGNVRSSNVSRYGDLSIENESVAAFQGWPQEWSPTASFLKVVLTGLRANVKPNININKCPSISSNIIDCILKQKIPKPVDPTKHALKQQPGKQKKPVDIKAQKKRQYLDGFMKELIAKLFNTTEKQQRVLNSPRGPIKHPECHFKILEAFDQKCFNLHENPYAGKYSSVLSNICSEGVNVDAVIKKMIDHCQGIPVSNVE